MSKNIQEVKDDQKNFLITLLLIIVILFGINSFFPNANQDEVKVPVTPVAQTINAPVVQQNAIDVALAQKSVAVENNFIKGDFSPTLGGLNDLFLLKYKETTEKNSPDVELLSKKYFTSLNFDSTNAVMPLNTDNWQVIGDKLTPQTPITLIFENEDVKITRLVEIDNAYMVTVTDTVGNLKNQPITVTRTGKIVRQMDREPIRSSVHEGFVAFLQNELVEEKYNAVEDEAFNETSTGGWMGLTDKYWQTILIFDQSEPMAINFQKGADNMYTASFTSPVLTINPNQSITRTMRTFAGAKDINIINDYQQQLNIPRFDLSIDFGWFYFLTKPFLAFLNWLYGMIGNMGIAILIFATVIRIALLPIAKKSYESMAKIRKIQPKLVALQSKFKNDRQRLQIETMQLYKREKVNPAAGCLPMLLQIPIFYALYKVLSVSINMRQAPFFGWIHDLSVPDPSSIFTLCGLINWPVPSIINIGILPVLMGITMFIQQRMNPAPTDPMQAKMMKWLPVIFTFMLGGFASGLVIYWTWSNILSIAQQHYIMKKIEGKK